MESGSYADILFFAIFAVFIFFKLFSTIGKQDGTEERMKERIEKLKKEAEEKGEKVVHLSGSKFEEPKKERTRVIDEPNIKDDGLRETLARMGRTDGSFTPGKFTEGAKMAYEMVYSAFSKGDKRVLKDLLEDDVEKAFIDAIDALEKEKQTQEIILVAINHAEISEAILARNVAQITVEFESEQIRIIRDEEGEIIDGDAKKVEEVSDTWVFERDLKSSNPNWVIIST